MIQITAPISHGTSGSPVMDENGQVIGVATLLNAEGQNLNFAIPVEQVSAALTEPPSVRVPAPTLPEPTIPTPAEEANTALPAQTRSQGPPDVTAMPPSQQEQGQRDNGGSQSQGAGADLF